MRWNQWNWTACKHVGELLEKLEMLQKGMKILNSLGRVLKKRKAKSERLLNTGEGNLSRSLIFVFKLVCNKWNRLEVQRSVDS